MSKRKRKPITRKEYDILMDYFQNKYEGYNYTSITYQRIVVLLYFTGMRLNETQEITKGDITETFEYEELKLHTPKQSKRDKNGVIIKKRYRYIPLSNEALKTIQSLYFFQESKDTVWCGKGKSRKERYHNINLIQQFNKHIKIALGEGYSSHSFRQGLITEMIESKKNINITVIQEFIGHASEQTTMKYYRPDDKKIRENLIR